MFDDNTHFDYVSPWDGSLSDLAQDGGWQENAMLSSWEKYQFSDTIGDPTMPKIAQTTEFTCAVVSQQMILNDFGIDVSEAQLVYDATSNGWLTDNGTSPEDMGKLLEKYGIETHTNYSGDIASVIDELSRGHKIIVPVNSTELWNGVSWWQRLTGFHNTGADHAIVVTGVDFSDQAHPQVIVNDPGMPGGGSQAYPLEHFLESWNDSNYTYLATDDAPAGLAHSTLGAQFDESTGLYNTPEFWIDIAAKVAGAAIAAFVADLYSGDGGLPISEPSPWESLTEAALNQLFLTI